MTTYAERTAAIIANIRALVYSTNMIVQSSDIGTLDAERVGTLISIIEDQLDSADVFLQKSDFIERSEEEKEGDK